MEKRLKRRTRNRYKLTRNGLIYLLVGLFVFGGFLVTVIGQQIDLSEIYKEQAFYEKENASKKEALEEAELDEAYSSSDEFYEDKARDEGYIREGEVQFVVGN